MKINLRRLPIGTGKWTGKEKTSSLALEECGVFPLGLLTFSLEAEYAQRDFFVVGSLALNVRLQCVTCLHNLPYEIRVESFSVHLKSISKQSIIDLTPFIREDMLLAIPTYPRCESISYHLLCSATLPAASSNDLGRLSLSSAGSVLKSLKIKNN